ncbi:sialin-like isoform X2 [Gigantopelta aegis]|uniref:sialin-like isoform X2 n=1 Tax=Gigantopelta aegis TaxID=1735272 RepID=UPI001B88A29A|nr:sialin-like isoform X2 [Gigantopelta aegis]XP_041372281.1 sialin-like isoform X2 [Gigantopelta aegis]
MSSPDETKNSETKPSGTEAAKENDSEKRPPESDGKSESPPGQADVQPKEESDTKPQCPIPEFKTPKSPRSPVDRPRRGSKPRKSIHMMSVFNDIEVMRTPSPMSLADTFPKTRPRRRSSLSLMLQQDTPILPIVRQVELTTGEKLIIQPDGERPKEVPFWTSYRFRYAIIWFFGCICMSAQRGDLSIAIVSMVDHKYFYDLEHNLTLNGTMGVSEKTCELVQAKQMNEGEFRWNKEFQGFLLGSYFWGFLVLQVPGGRLAEKFGAKHVVGITTFLVAIISILSPIMARTSKHLFLISRIITGVCQGVMIPAAQAFWARWSPLNERSRLIGLTIAGVPIGSAVIFPVGGQLCAYGFDNGWASVFYVIGGIAFLWCIIWNVFIYNSPSECPHISEIELKYIEASLGTKPKHRETPWRAFLTSRALWAIIIAALCANFTSFMLATQLPTYMKDILKFDIASNGTYSMLPYLWLWFFTLFSVMCADHLIFQNILSVASTRKLMSGIGNGFIFPGCFLLATGRLDCTQQLAATMTMSASVGFLGFQLSGFMVNTGDIAPQYAGTLFGITNTLSTWPGIVAPSVAGILTPNGTREEWQIVFHIAAAINFFGAVFYAIMASGEIQDWAKPKEEDDNDDIFRNLFEIKEESSEVEHNSDEEQLKGQI